VCALSLDHQRTWKLAAHASMAAVYPCTSRGIPRPAASATYSSACSQRPTCPAACTSVPYTTALGLNSRCCMSAYRAITCTHRAPSTAAVSRLHRLTWGVSITHVCACQHEQGVGLMLCSHLAEAPRLAVVGHEDRKRVDGGGQLEAPHPLQHLVVRLCAAASRVPCEIERT
jgi:hypothetical protein